MQTILLRTGPNTWRRAAYDVREGGLVAWWIGVPAEPNLEIRRRLRDLVAPGVPVL